MTKKSISCSGDYCKWYGGTKHNDRHKKCPAYSKECLKCGHMDHFKKQCVLKSKVADNKSKISNEAFETESEEIDGGVYNIGRG